MKKLAPGVYDDENGGLHIATWELLAAHGYPDTPENRATLEQAARNVFGAANVPVEVDQDRESWRDEPMDPHDDDNAR